jgi:hypothetical protein
VFSDQSLRYFLLAVVYLFHVMSLSQCVVSHELQIKLDSVTCGMLMHTDVFYVLRFHYKTGP